MKMINKMKIGKLKFKQQTVQDIHCKIAALGLQQTIRMSSMQYPEMLRAMPLQTLTPVMLMSGLE